jgi:hypothetical protein
MIDKSRPGAADRPAPEFLPVPRQCNRHDGWTAERQQGFIRALMETGSVRAAAHAVNMTPEGAYHLRRHPGAGSFRKAWEQALAAGVQRLEDLAMDRALNGEEVPVYSYGKLVGTRRVWNDRLLMFILRNRAPTRFAAGSTGNNIVRQQQEQRLRRKLRAEWEAEQAAPTAETEQLRARLTRRMDAAAEEFRDSLTPHTRALLDEFHRSLAADETREPDTP